MPSPEPILALLSSAPQRIAALTGDLTPELLNATPAPGEWSANAVLAHLRACADVWGSCIEAIIAQDRPTLRAVNPRTWIERTDYREQDFHTAQRVYTAQREKLMAVLDPLQPSAWERSAIVTGAGKTLERTVFFYAQWLAHHERPHIKQIGRVAEVLRSRL